MTQTILAPSILSANVACLGEEVKKVLAAGSDWIHIDVMDNHYVPNLTFGPLVCQGLRDYGITAPLDVHLMVEPVDELIVAFAKAGATSISIHPEATRHLDRSLQLIKDHGCLAGLALNPATPIDWLDYVLQKLDLILIMSVNPGFGGQKFIPESLEKIKAVRALIETSQKNIHLAVDGGINAYNIRQVADAGANAFVAGSAIFHGDNYAANIASLQQALSSS